MITCLVIRFFLVFWSYRCGKFENYINDTNVEVEDEYEYSYRNDNDTAPLIVYTDGYGRFKIKNTNDVIHCYMGLLGIIIFVISTIYIITLIRLILFITYKIIKIF
jgi:hypothetical protein